MFNYAKIVQIGAVILKTWACECCGLNDNNNDNFVNKRNIRA